MEKLFTVVYVDSRGTGRSGRAKTTKEYTWDHLVGDLEALRVHLDQDSVWLMGHSAAGEQVLQYACKYPKRVRGLVLLNTRAVGDDKSVADIQKRIAWRKGKPWYEDATKALQTNPQTDEQMAQMLKAALPLYWSDPAKAERFKDDFAAMSASAVAYAGVLESKRLGFDLRASLRNVTAPALIVVGDDDFVCSPESATILHLALPKSKLLVIEESGHFPWMEQPDVFEKRVPEFLYALGLVAK
jgi:proline iminopeptidase